MVALAHIISEWKTLQLEKEISAEVRDIVSKMDGDAAWATHGPDPKRSLDRSMRAGTRLYEMYIAIQEFVMFRKSIEDYK